MLAQSPKQREIEQNSLLSQIAEQALPSFGQFYEPLPALANLPEK